MWRQKLLPLTFSPWLMIKVHTHVTTTQDLAGYLYHGCAYEATVAVLNHKKVVERWNLHLMITLIAHHRQGDICATFMTGLCYGKTSRKYTTHERPKVLKSSQDKW